VLDTQRPHSWQTRTSLGLLPLTSCVTSLPESRNDAFASILWNAFWAVVAVVSALTGVSLGQGNGSIHGIVLDDIGKSVKDATVYATPLDRPLASVIPCDISDEGGAYSISTLDYGRYSVSVAKPDEGYPESDMTFYAGFHARLNVVGDTERHRCRSGHRQTSECECGISVGV
jgi:hypothetical protein